MKRAEDLLAPNGKTWEEIRAKRMAAKEKRIARKKSQKGQTKAGTSQQKRRTETLKWRAFRKRYLWDNGEGFLGFPICGLCGNCIQSFADCELDHKIPSRRGGDNDANTHLAHTLGNRAKGSRTLEAYLAGKTQEQLSRACGLWPQPK